MTNPELNSTPEQPTNGTLTPSQSFERYDLTGYRIKRWTLVARQKLLSGLRSLLRFGRTAADTQLPGLHETLGEKGKNLPGKGVELLEAHIQKAPIENQLKVAQTQTEYLKQELLREEIRNRRADTRGKQLCNSEREIAILERLRELIDGRANTYMFNDGDNDFVVIGSLPAIRNTPSQNDAESVTCLGLTERAIGHLEAGGVTTVDDVLRHGRESLLSIRGIGAKTIDAIEQSLKDRGIQLPD